ncbi:ABC transporter permease [Paenibacillus filicis]|uniref:ABC transporter permease n=1 Tax=Paenibacillus gyeongsangnamensis TaxID=3388067 RepID=A0ABT4Q7E3_9BACL|nr:ABC transporter permease [Paenibacillus filicis]MCZ8512792.1 ABC transporter permease [Paenibacillus filicis]
MGHSRSESHLRRLWSKRTAEFFRELRPYIGYSLQSASLAITLIMLACTYGYRRFLTDVPPGFPLLFTAAIALLPALAVSPIRTYLREADLIYLLPLESSMPVYLRRAEARSLGIQGALLLAAWLIVWPLYKLGAGGGIVDFLRVLAVLLLGKKVLLHGRWSELQQAARTQRFLLSLRWAVALGLTWSQMTLSPLIGLICAGAGLLLYLGLMRFLDRRVLLWVHLIAMEARQRANIFRLLNFFVDVPDSQGRARSIHAPEPILRWISGYRFRSSDTYRFLYTRVWLRSEWFGMTVRLTAAGFVVLSVVPGRWPAAGLFVLFSFLILIQLKELQKAYRHSDWSYVYPLPESLRSRSAANVRYRLHAAASLVLLVPAAARLHSIVWTGALLALTAIISYGLHRPK